MHIECLLGVAKDQGMPSRVRGMVFELHKKGFKLRGGFKKS